MESNGDLPEADFWLALPTVIQVIYCPLFSCNSALVQTTERDLGYKLDSAKR